MTENNTTADMSSGEIEPAHLAEVTRAALPYLGTYSITAVKQASKGCDSLNMLCQLIADQIMEAGKRDRFMETARSLVRRLQNPEMAAEASPPPQTQVPASGRPATPITPELMQRGERALAHIIGPLAAVLVARYAKTAENSRQFFELLASHIRNPEERQTFIEVVRSQLYANADRLKQ